MPLFSSKFTPKKSVPRQASSISTLHREFDTSQSKTELGIDYGPVTVKLSERVSTLNPDTGEWEASNWKQQQTERDKEQRDNLARNAGNAMDNNSSNEVGKLRKINKKLQDENRLLKLKIEILLDMVSNDLINVMLGNSGVLFLIKG